MILWSIIPIETILQDMDKIPPSTEISYAGSILEVQSISPSECQIIRVIDSNPNTFLLPELQPGSILTYKKLASQ